MGSSGGKISHSLWQTTCVGHIYIYMVIGWQEGKATKGLCFGYLTITKTTKCEKDSTNQKPREKIVRASTEEEKDREKKIKQPSVLFGFHHSIIVRR